MAFQNYVNTSLAHNEQAWNEQRQWNQNITQIWPPLEKDKTKSTTL
jgi:hypothetical protein